MGNMSDYRFENTYSFLLSCQEILDDGNVQELSDIETKYMHKLVKICKEIASEHRLLWLILVKINSTS